MIGNIRQIISDEMNQFEAAFAASLSTDVPLLNASVDHFLQKKGKGFRPILLFLAAKATKGTSTPATVNAAVALELLHSASLIHDDVVDETLERRGMMTLNARFNNKISVLTGDYFLSVGLQKAIETGNLSILNEVYTFAKTTTQGELVQLATARDAIISESNYFNIIYKKTASLFVACVRSGCISVGATAEVTDRLAQFARLLGLCFQIRDDIFDFFPEINAGKPAGNDIREGKITLPLLYALRENSDPETLHISSLIEKKEFSTENIALIIDFAKRKGGIDYANQRMQEMYQEGIQLLDLLDDSPYKEALVSLLSYAIQREK